MQPQKSHLSPTTPQCFCITIKTIWNQLKKMKIFSTNFFHAIVVGFFVHASGFLRLWFIITVWSQLWNWVILFWLWCSPSVGCKSCKVGKYLHFAFYVEEFLLDILTSISGSHMNEAEVLYVDHNRTQCDSYYHFLKFVLTMWCYHSKPRLVPII
jgi:hypothetical protein